MKYIISLLLLFPISSQATDGYPPQDKQLHYITSYALTVSLYSVYKKAKAPCPWLLAAGSTLALGALKEATDSTWDGGDMKANALGVSTGIIFNYVIGF